MNTKGKRKAWQGDKKNSAVGHKNATVTMLLSSYKFMLKVKNKNKKYKGSVRNTTE